MNQILISKKLYVTPEIKRKKAFFKIEFFLSIFLLIALSSYCIYAEYDRNKDEAVSKDILEQIEFQDDTVVKKVIVITLNDALENNQIEDQYAEEPTVYVEEQEVPIEITPEQLVLANDGTTYYTIGKINIPKINVDYPILSSDYDNIDTLLKISPCKFWGANPNEVGNLCIVGHNYRNTKFFSKVPTLEHGDIIEIQDLSGRILSYEVYDKYIVDPDDTDCTTQLTAGIKEVTLITCTNDNSQRVIVKARESVE